MTLITVQDGKIVLRDGNVGTEEGCCCEPQGDCTTEDTCWLIEFDLEFLSAVWWRFEGMGQQWLPLQSTHVLWVDVDDFTQDRRTCNDGVAVDEANPGPPGWEVQIATAFDALVRVEAGDCEEGVAVTVRSDFSETYLAIYLAIGDKGQATVTTVSLTQDLTQENPAGAVDEEVVRGTITVTRTSPVEKGDCGCP